MKCDFNCFLLRQQSQWIFHPAEDNGQLSKSKKIQVSFSSSQVLELATNEDARSPITSKWREKWWVTIKLLPVAVATSGHLVAMGITLYLLMAIVTIVMATKSHQVVIPTILVQVVMAPSLVNLQFVFQLWQDSAMQMF